MKTAIVHHPIFAKHDTGPGHPETPRRYQTVINAIRSDEDDSSGTPGMPGTTQGRRRVGRHVSDDADEEDSEPAPEYGGQAAR